MTVFWKNKQTKSVFLLYVIGAHTFSHQGPLEICIASVLSACLVPETLVWRFGTRSRLGTRPAGSGTGSPRPRSSLTLCSWTLASRHGWRWWCHLYCGNWCQCHPWCGHSWHWTYCWSGCPRAMEMKTMMLYTVMSFGKELKCWWWFRYGDQITALCSLGAHIRTVKMNHSPPFTPPKDLDCVFKTYIDL